VVKKALSLRGLKGQGICFKGSVSAASLIIYIGSPSRWETYTKRLGVLRIIASKEDLSLSV
jgi:hypothetical protein